ncbi:serine/arginine repetitive matrix protein 1-like [Corythoichthys intestinalis]|uniref:serine/arginine repetitive matrix protein 1-like n=1 Tax=Corythoichthys intestinalis TaxID=161448 RepID=UPI0025A5C876|nr:serine/arginine repetitive matrix protein 1-like [Corythoichthys intestinalis]
MPAKSESCRQEGSDSCALALPPSLNSGFTQEAGLSTRPTKPRAEQGPPPEQVTSSRYTGVHLATRGGAQGGYPGREERGRRKQENAEEPPRDRSPDLPPTPAAGSLLATITQHPARPTALCRGSPVEYDVCGALKKVQERQGLPCQGERFLRCKLRSERIKRQAPVGVAVSTRTTGRRAGEAPEPRSTPAPDHPRHTRNRPPLPPPPKHPTRTPNRCYAKRRRPGVVHPTGKGQQTPPKRTCRRPQQQESSGSRLGPYRLTGAETDQGDGGGAAPVRHPHPPARSPRAQPTRPPHDAPRQAPAENPGARPGDGTA